MSETRKMPVPVKTVTPECLNAAWRRYCDLFGEYPHGTVQQMAALLELVKEDATHVHIPLETARLVDAVFLPTNPRKMRNAAPEVVEAAIDYKQRICRPPR